MKATVRPTMSDRTSVGFRKLFTVAVGYRHSENSQLFFGQHYPPPFLSVLCAIVGNG
jgi:hypothetical protein